MPSIIIPLRVEEHIAPLIYSRCSMKIEVKIADQIVECLIDTGAEVNVMTSDVVKKLGIE